MTVRVPSGVRDLLPQAAARRRGIVSALTSELERWGYRSIMTPIYEYDEVLRRGLGAPARAMRFVEPSTGEVLALRPDFTAQVARLVATRLHDEPGPLRLCYEGSVVRLAQGELFQVGVELIDAPQPGGDLEVIALAEAALRAASANDLALDLGHADIARAALEDLALDEAGHEALHQALAKKNESAVAVVAKDARLPAKRQKLLQALPSLHGGPEVLARTRALVDKKSAAAQALDELELLIERLSALAPHSRLSLDLGEVRGFDYYTGTRFAIYADGVGGALASGGRYDRLVERYGRSARSTGFAIHVERVAELLKVRGVAPPQPRGGLLIGGDPVLAPRLGARMRAVGLRAVQDLDDPAPSDGVLKDRALRAGLDRVIVTGAQRLRWFDVSPAGARGSLAGAALKKLLTEEGTAALDAVLPPR
jgi:ATP phosphoribosyltransferase regulatory subunit